MYPHGYWLDQRGYGWVVRNVTNNTLCNRAVGIDGAEQMIANAESRGGDAEYIHANINSFNSPEKYDVIHSMEVLYYLEDPSGIVRKISDSWLNKGGRLIVGVDHYYENTDSHSWQEKVGTRMLMLKESEWVQIFEMAGLDEVESWHSNKHQNGALDEVGICKKCSFKDTYDWVEVSAFRK